jgi:hypothetical protein
MNLFVSSDTELSACTQTIVQANTVQTDETIINYTNSCPTTIQPRLTGYFEDSLTVNLVVCRSLPVCQHFFVSIMASAIEVPSLISVLPSWLLQVLLVLGFLWFATVVYQVIGFVYRYFIRAPINPKKFGSWAGTLKLASKTYSRNP